MNQSINIPQGEKITDDKEYEICTLKEAEEFAEKRNYVWNGVSPSVNKQYTVCPWDEWKANKDIA